MSQTTRGFIGQRLRRREDIRHLRGDAEFLPDLPGHGVLEVAFVRSQESHALLRAVGVTSALRVDGVAGVLTIDDVRARSKPFRPNITRPGLQQFSWYALADDRVRFVGQPIAAVAAVDRYTAEDAAHLVEVEYESLPPVVSTEEALRAGSPLLYPEWGSNILFEKSFDIGDVQRALDREYLIVREQFQSQRHTGVPMEGRGCLARYDRRTGRLFVWSSTQWPHPLRTVLADLLQMPEASIEVTAPDVGGGFGNKQHMFREEVAVCLLALKLKRPVRWVEDRHENLTSSVHARQQVHDIEAAVDASGRITALRATITADMGDASTYFVGIAPQLVTADSLPGPYRVQHYSYNLRCVVTTKCPSGAYRGFGRATATLSMERLMDIIARKLNLDPADVRRRNLLTEEELPYRLATGSLLDSGRYHESLDMALGLTDYPSWREAQVEGRANGRHIGIGIACLIEGTAPSVRGSTGRWGSYEACTARLEPDGRLSISTGLSPHGQGLATAMAQVAADELGVSPDVVDVCHGSTSTTPYGLGTWGGRGAAMGGAVVIRAVRQVRMKIEAIAAELLEAAPTDLEIADGYVVVRGSPERSVALSEVATVAYHQTDRLPRGVQPGIVFTESYEPAGIETRPDSLGRLNNYGAFSNATHVAVVEADAETGEVTVLKYVVVHDCGTMINPSIVEGQIAGGVAQGIGGAMFEEIVYDDTGQCVTGSLMDYLVPTASEVPTIVMAHMETPAPFIEGGFKAAGEGGAIGAPAALANAVTDALLPFNVNVTSTPMSPGVLLRLIAEDRS